MAHSKADTFDSKTASLARLAKALSHPARIAILETLAKKNSCVCGEIVKVLPLAQSTVSQHLRELKEAELITGEIEGLTSCYCINEEKIKELEKHLSSFLGVLKKGLKSKKYC
jgi:DNA-binding transcriptional ArsR family regulator